MDTCSKGMCSPKVADPSVVHHLNNMNRRLANQDYDIGDLARRVEQIERFLGVNFASPRPPMDASPLDFTTGTL